MKNNLQVIFFRSFLLLVLFVVKAHLLLVLIMVNFRVPELEILDQPDPLFFTPKLPYSCVLERFLILQLKEDGKPNNSGDLRDSQPPN